MYLILIIRRFCVSRSLNMLFPSISDCPNCFPNVNLPIDLVRNLVNISYTVPLPSLIVRTAHKERSVSYSLFNFNVVNQQTACIRSAGGGVTVYTRPEVIVPRCKTRNIDRSR